MQGTTVSSRLILYFSSLMTLKNVFLAVLGLRYCEGFSLVAASGGSSLVVVCRLLISAASLIERHGP